MYGKANDNTAIILRFDFDPAEVAKRLEDLEFMERVAEVVESRKCTHYLRFNGLDSPTDSDFQTSTWKSLL